MENFHFGLFLFFFFFFLCFIDDGQNSQNSQNRVNGTWHQSGNLLETEIFSLLAVFHGFDLV